MKSDEPHQVHVLRPLSEAPTVSLTELGTGGAEEAISNAIFHLLRVHAGRAPTTARTVLTSDLAVVTLRGCLTTVERTLANLGETGMVMEVRAALHDVIRAEATAAVEEITGRRVVAYLTDQEHEPDVAIIAFVLWSPQPHGPWADSRSHPVA